MSRIGKDCLFIESVKLGEMSQEHKMLEAPIELEEIHKAIMALRCNSGPGSDGLTPEFYIKKSRHVISGYLH